MRRDFEGGVYWDETCGDISRAAGFRGAARFRGNTVIIIHSCGLHWWGGYVNFIGHNSNNNIIALLEKV